MALNDAARIIRFLPAVGEANAAFTLRSVWALLLVDVARNHAWGGTRGPILSVRDPLRPAQLFIGFSSPHPGPMRVPALEKDGNNSLYPLAWAQVQGTGEKTYCGLGMCHMAQNILTEGRREVTA